MTKSRARLWPVFLVTAIGSFVVSLDLSIVNVAFPALEQSFPHVTRGLLSWVITGYGIVFGFLLVVGGRTADRLGRRRIFFVGLGVFTAGSALCGFAPSVPLLIAGRLIQGAGAAFTLPASLGLLLAAFPKERRSQVVSLWGGLSALAVATGPTLGAVIVSQGGWRWAFSINIPIGFVAWFFGRKVLTESREPLGLNQPDYLGVSLLAVSLAGLVLAISEGQSWGWTDTRVLGSLAVTILLGPIFILRSRRHAEPVLDLSLFSNRAFSAANIGTLLYSMGFFALLLGNFLFLTSVWHYSILRAGLAVTPGPVIVALVAGPAGRIATKVGFRIPLLIGAASFSAALFVFATTIGLHPDYLGSWLPVTILAGIGIGFSYPVLSAAAVSALPPNRFAVGSAVNQTCRQIGGALGVAVLVAILGNASSPGVALDRFHHLWVFCALAALGSGVPALWQTRPRVSGSTAPVIALTYPETAAPGAASSAATSGSARG